RSSGGAKEDIKFDYEVAEGDAQFRVHLEFERGAPGDQLAAAAEALLVLGLREWQEGRLTLGGRAGSGLGVFVLDEVEVRLLDLSDRDTLRNWLRARTSAAPAGRQAGVVLPGGLNALGAVGARGVVAYQAGPDGSSPGWLTAVVDLQADGPLLVAGASPVPQIVDHGPTHVADTSGSDAQALGRRGGGGDTSPILPGSSLRGVLRSRAEQVVRFLGGPAAACDPFEDDARSPRLSCGRRALPGAAAGLAVENASPARRRQLEGGRALALRNGSCPVCRLFGTSQLGGRVTVAESLLEGGSVQLLDHVAIDRFTGGAVDARKFDAAPVVGARARLTIRVDRPTPSDAVLMLFVLRDLAEGWVPVGSRVTRGYGAVRGRLSELEVADVGAGPWAAVTAGADVEPGAIWRARRFTPPGTTFLGRDHAWDWLDDESELRRALVGGAKELSAQSSAWQLGIENRSPSNDN
ncbi:MAG: RAMP superfamily CRISPR-associated protein, partial [Acidimicrobiales bacterium]